MDTMKDSNIEIVRYCDDLKGEWDKFVSSSRNSSFIFMRDYMDYHADRFRDCSWVIRKKGSIKALLPANITDDGVLHSHQGLTYGGWILPMSHVDGEDLLDYFVLVSDVWRGMGINMLDYKPMPHIYALRPSQEDIYSLFRLGAVITEVNLSMSIDYSSPGVYNKLRRRTLQKTTHLRGKVVEMRDPEMMMEVLVECLAERHDAKPVHTLEEMRMLKSRFPGQIRFFGIPSEKKPGMAAAVCVYDTGVVAHVQYIATTEEGRLNNLLTPLFTVLIQDVFSERRYFDFGTSNENNGQILNAGLLRQKASFGASGVACMRYSFKL